MKIVIFKNKILKIIREIDDKKYGKIIDGYLAHKKVYIIDGKVVKSQAIIDELDNEYGIPVSERGVYY